MSDSVQPHRWQPTRPRRPQDSPGKNTGVGCHFLLQCMKVKSESEVTQLCPTLSDPMDCSLPGSSAHGIFQARVLEWGAIHCVDDNKLWKILKELGDTKTPYLHSEKPVCSQDATVKIRHRTMDWFKIGIRLCEGCILSSCLFNFYAEYIM